MRERAMFLAPSLVAMAGGFAVELDGWALAFAADDFGCRASERHGSIRYPAPSSRPLWRRSAPRSFQSGWLFLRSRLISALSV